MANPFSTASSLTSRARTGWFFFLLAATNLMWAAQGTIVKYLDKMGPLAVALLPFSISIVMLIPLLLHERRKNPNFVRPTKRDWIMFGWAGVAGQIAAQVGATWGIKLSLASNFSILNLMIPVFTAVLASFMLREKVTPLRLLCLGIGLLGVMLLSVNDLKNSSFFESTYLKGNLLILVGCLGSAFYNVYCKGLMDRFTEVEILIYSYITAAIASIPLLIWVEPFHFSVFAAFTWQAWVAFFCNVLFVYVISMILFFYVLQHLEVTVASASIYLIPLFGVLLAYFLLHEKLSALSIVGGVIVLAATTLIMKYDTME